MKSRGRALPNSEKYEKILKKKNLVLNLNGTQPKSFFTGDNAFQRPTVCLVDGTGLLYRAHYGMPDLTDKNGNPVGALVGFVRALASLRTRWAPKSCVVAFDHASPTWRHALFPNYKVHRKPTPEALVAQWPLVYAVCALWNVETAVLPGYEADDLLATCAAQAVSEGFNAALVSLDKDFLQCVGPYVVCAQKTVVGPAEVQALWGVFPNQMAAMQALVGDASDGVPGVPGVGPKTAAKLLQHHTNMHAFFEDGFFPKRWQETLLAHKTQAFLSERLTRLDQNAPWTAKWSTTWDDPALLRWCDVHGMVRLKHFLHTHFSPTSPHPSLF